LAPTRSTLLFPRSSKSSSPLRWRPDGFIVRGSRSDPGDALPTILPPGSNLYIGICFFLRLLIREVLELLRLCAHEWGHFHVACDDEKVFLVLLRGEKRVFFPSVHGVSRLVRAESDSLRGSTWLHGLAGTRQEFTHARCFCGSAGAAFSGDVPMAVFQTWTV